MMKLLVTLFIMKLTAQMNIFKDEFSLIKTTFYTVLPTHLINQNFVDCSPDHFDS